MKIIKKIKSAYLLAGASILFIMGCGGPQGEKAKATEAKELGTDQAEKTMIVNTEKSMVAWLGSKPTGQHIGTIHLTGGEILLDGKTIIGGKFTIDMNSIVNTDLEDEEYNQKLVKHLKSTDFFNTEEFPQAEFAITGVTEWEGGQVEEGETGKLLTPTHQITGNLTIKGISKSITFPAVVKIEDNVLQAHTPQFVVDRTAWDIKFKSNKFFDNLKDNFIFDEIGLKIILLASTQN